MVVINRSDHERQLASDGRIGRILFYLVVAATAVLIAIPAAIATAG